MCVTCRLAGVQLTMQDSSVFEVSLIIPNYDSDHFVLHSMRRDKSFYSFCSEVAYDIAHQNYATIYF